MKVHAIAVMCALALSIGSALADDSHHPEATTSATPPKGQPAKPSSKPATRPAAPKNMDSSAMKHMQETMAKMQNSSDPAERRQLMDEHMGAMKEAMASMHDQKGAPEQRMDMMQSMMEQMMMRDDMRAKP